MSLQFDLSRDFLDGLMIQQPPPVNNGKGEVRAGGQLHFLPSSPDGTMHTAIVSFALFSGPEGTQGGDQPFARAGWRFLFTTSERFDPKADPQNAFFGQLLMLGAGKIMVQLNNLCMHANLPLIPFEPSRMVLQSPPEGQAPGQAAATQG